MSATWLVLDSSFLVYRAQYAMKEEGNAVFGFMATMLSLRQRFDSNNLVFAFDRGPLLRNKILPTYKDRDRSPEHEAEHKRAQGSMQQLRREILRPLGFQNIFSQPGYEADDIIASIVKWSLPKGDDAVIVSADKDLWQLLAPNVVMYNPNSEQLINEAKFRAEWGISPFEWAQVKSIAGCSSDNVPGVKGVGEKTAAKYIAGTLARHLDKYDKVHKADWNAIRETYKLVCLPYEGVQQFTLKTDDINWRKLSTYGARDVANE